MYLRSFLYFYIFITLFLANTVYSQPQNQHIYIVSFKLPAIASDKTIFQNKSLSQSRVKTIDFQHQQLLTHINQHFNKQFEILFDYKFAINAISLELTSTEADFIARQDNILHVSKQKILHIATDASASLINADTLWSGSGIAPLAGVQGEDIVVAVIDTGINMEHESFFDNPEDSYNFATHNPLGTDNFTGWCDPNNIDFDINLACNNKLIGAWDFVDVFGNETDGPLDSNFHGSSMSGIISGNHITAPIGGFVFSFAGGVLDAPFISGIAPHSHIIIYDVCDNTIGCPSSAVLAAIDQAILDGVDIINLALDGGISPWETNSIGLALLNANNLGIITSTAAGNATSAVPDTIGRVSNLAPWVITAANSLHGRTQSNDTSVLNPLPVPDFLIDIYSLLAQGITIIVDINAKVFIASDVDINNELGCTAWNALDFNAAIALIKSGTCSNESKVQNAEDAGAIAVIIYSANSDLPETMTGINTPTIPAIMIGLTDAINIINHVQVNVANDTIIEILADTKHKIVDALGFVLYHSSLRGPNDNFDITKPDLTAPGTNIFAAIAELGELAPQYFTTTGTSQSSAVTSGSLALLKNIHPNWSPSELKSSIMLTAQYGPIGISHEDMSATTTDDVGSGLLDIQLAANTVLVMDESMTNYVNANPDIGGLPHTLNIPSLRNNRCFWNCNWSRTLVNKDSKEHTWIVLVDHDSNSNITVVPSSFTLMANESVQLEIGFENVLGGAINQNRFATVTLIDTNFDETPRAKLTIVVKIDDLIFKAGFE